MPFNGGEIAILERIKGVFSKKQGEQNARDLAEREIQTRMMVKAMEESAHVAAFVSAATLVNDADLLICPEAETPTGEQIADMSDEELGVLLKLADESARVNAQTQELKANLANLESAEGWEIADDLADIVLGVVESRENFAEQWRACHGIVSAEIQRRRRAAEHETNKRRFLKDNQSEFIEAMILGDDERLAELREQLENPPEAAEEPPFSVSMFEALQSADAEPARSGDDAPQRAVDEAAQHFRRQYAAQNERQDGAGED